jgi:hypothetical protein
MGAESSNDLFSLRLRPTIDSSADTVVQIAKRIKVLVAKHESGWPNLHFDKLRGSHLLERLVGELDPKSLSHGVVDCLTNQFHLSNAQCLIVNDDHETPLV